MKQPASASASTAIALFTAVRILLKDRITAVVNRINAVTKKERIALIALWVYIALAIEFPVALYLVPTILISLLLVGRFFYRKGCDDQKEENDNDN